MCEMNCYKDKRDSHFSRLYPTGKKLPTPLYCRLCGPQIQCEQSSEDKNSSAFTEDRTPARRSNFMIFITWLLKYTRQRKLWTLQCKCKTSVGAKCRRSLPNLWIRNSLITEGKTIKYFFASVAKSTIKTVQTVSFLRIRLNQQADTWLEKCVLNEHFNKRPLTD
jgi:hypothetical protein